MDNPGELRARAAHYRDLAAQITDARARAGIIELARQYEQHATGLVATPPTREGWENDST
jgi:hypothetical protein